MAWDSPSPWVVTVGQAQDRAARAAGALNLGGIFLRGREIAQRRKEFEAEEPLRKAQQEINDLRKEEARLRLDTLMEQRRNIHETQNDIGAWMGQFGRLQTIGLENPDSVKSGYDWWSKHHKLIRTPEGKALYEDWDASVKASQDNQARIKRDSENALNILGRQMVLEAERQTGREKIEEERTRRALDVATKNQMRRDVTLNPGMRFEQFATRWQNVIRSATGLVDAAEVNAELLKNWEEIQKTATELNQKAGIQPLPTNAPPAAIEQPQVPPPNRDSLGLFE